MAAMTTLAAATGAPHSIRLNNSEWFITPLTAREWGEFDSWVRSEYIALMKRETADLDKDLRDKILLRAFDQAAKLGAEEPEMSRITNGQEGLRRLFRMHLVSRHPDITEEDVAQLLASPEAAALVLGVINDTIGPGVFPGETTKKKRQKKVTKHRTDRRKARKQTRRNGLKR